MPNIFDTLANDLLNRRSQYVALTNFGEKNWFGLIYRGYDGLMAKPRIGQSYVDRNKEGYFDIFICTGDRYLDRDNYKQVTHYNLFNDLLENSSLNNCYRLWQGEFPTHITNDVEEQKALSALALLMFEQELNWGDECWQRHSNFPSSTQYPFSRPRDMIMGFINIAFHLDSLDDYPYWNYKLVNGIITPTTPTFGRGYRNLEEKYFQFFNELTEDDSAEPLMIGQYLNRFRVTANNAPNNPHYNGINWE